MFLIESGRLWSIDLAGRTADFLENEHEVRGAAFADHGVVFAESDETLSFYRFDDGVTIDVRQGILDSGYRLNDTFRAAHEWRGGGYSLFGQWVVYRGSRGIFAYSLLTGEVRPVLLEPHGGEIRVDYRRPTIVDSGVMFIVGLESASGAVGATGPVWRVDLDAVLNR